MHFALPTLLALSTVACSTPNEEMVKVGALAPDRYTRAHPRELDSVDLWGSAQFAQFTEAECQAMQRCLNQRHFGDRVPQLNDY